MDGDKTFKTDQFVFISDMMSELTGKFMLQRSPLLKEHYNQVAEWHMTSVFFLRFLTKRVRQRTLQEGVYKNEKVGILQYFQTDVLLLYFPHTRLNLATNKAICLEPKPSYQSKIHEHRRSRHRLTTPLFSNFLFTNLFSIKFLYFFIISSLFPCFNLFVSIFIQSYVNIKLHVSTLYRY
jgi:hypothetical protein